MRYVFLWIILCNMLWVKAQGSFQNDYLIYIQFSDKLESTVDIALPQNFLSERALNRRQKYHILVDSTDLPVDQIKIARCLQWMPQAKWVGASRWMNAGLIALENIADTAGLGALPGVASYEIQKFPNPAGPPIAFRSMPDAVDMGMAQQQMNLIQYPPLLARGYDGSGLLIGITDSGFEWVDWSPSFDPYRQRLVANYNVMKGNDSVFTNGVHGAYVLQSLAGERNDTIYGTASGAYYTLISTENPFYEYLGEEMQWIIGAEYADSLGVDVINVSLGYTTFDTAIFNHSHADLDGQTTLISRGAQKASEKGIAVVTSAGNSGAQLWKKIGVPGDAPGVFTIGACNAAGTIAPFSSFGPSADGRVKPDVTAVGWDMLVHGLSNNTDAISGTSFSGPTMAGVVASLIQAFPTTPHQVIYDALRSSAHLFPNSDEQFGYGIPNAFLAYRILQAQSEGDRVKLYPNPTQEDHFYLENIPKVAFEEIKIFFNGQLFLDRKTELSDRVYFNTQFWTPGLYYVQCKDVQGETSSLKVHIK